MFKRECFWILRLNRSKFCGQNLKDDEISDINFVSQKRKKTPDIDKNTARKVKELSHSSITLNNIIILRICIIRFMFNKNKKHDCGWKFVKSWKILITYFVQEKHQKWNLTEIFTILEDGFPGKAKDENLVTITEVFPAKFCARFLVRSVKCEIVSCGLSLK